MMDRWALVTAGTLLSVAFPQISAGAQPHKPTKPAEIHGYDYSHVETQPATESLDLGMYARIREEGLNHSHIMEYASALFDDIGPRLTGSPKFSQGECLDTRPTYRDGLQQCAPGELG